MNVLLYFSNSRNRRAVGVFTSLWRKGDGGERWWFPVDLLEKRVEGEDKCPPRACKPPASLTSSPPRSPGSLWLATLIPSCLRPLHMLVLCLQFFLHTSSPSYYRFILKLPDQMSAPPERFPNGSNLPVMVFKVLRTSFGWPYVPTVISHPFWWLSEYSAFPSHADCEPPNGRDLSAVSICLSCT